MLLVVTPRIGVGILTAAQRDELEVRIILRDPGSEQAEGFVPIVSRPPGRGTRALWTRGVFNPVTFRPWNLLAI